MILLTHIPSLATQYNHKMMDILDSINSKYCQCESGAAGKTVGYLCPGTCLDYAYDKLGVEYSYALEIWKKDDRFLTQKSQREHRTDHGFKKTKSVQRVLRP